MRTVEIEVHSEMVHFNNDPRNYTVVEATGWDIGAPIGNGSTREKAIDDFKESWMLKYDEEIEVKEK